MMIDNSMVFDPAGTAITSGGPSTNTLDMGQNRDMGFGARNLKILVQCVTTFTAAGAATLNVQLQGAPDNGAGQPGPFSTVMEGGIQQIGVLAGNSKLEQFDLGVASKIPILQPQAATTATWSSGATTITVTSATGIQLGQYVAAALGYVAGIPPGSTVTGISGTTITISGTTTAAQGTAVTVYFSSQFTIPRFYRLNYVVATGPFTAGAVFAFAALDVDEGILYRSGFVVGN